jgi:hypothetical protein
MGENIKTGIRKIGFGMWIRFIWLGQRPIVRSCKDDNEPSRSTKDRNFDYLSVLLNGVS